MSGTGPRAADGRFRPDIQGLRALAVTVVVLFHAGVGLPGGFVGVDVFFVISGYVITNMLVSEQARSGRLDLGRFYLRRIRRLLPALAVVLVAVLLLGPLIGPPNGAEATVDTGRAGALFAANLQLLWDSPGYFDPTSELNPFLHLWTLSVEEQFYLGFPLLLVASTWLARRSRRRGSTPTGTAVEPATTALSSPVVTACVAAAATGSYLAAWLLPGALGDRLGVEGSASRIVFYGAPTRAWEFLAGALAALVVARRRSAVSTAGRGQDRARASVPSDAWSGLGLVLLAWAVLGFDESTPFPHVVGVVPVIAALALITGGEGRAGVLSRVLSSGPARWLGDRSYGWYLWHWPAIVFSSALLPDSGWARPAAALISLGPTALSHRFVEQPIRHGDPVVGRTLALGSACVAAPLLVSLAFAPIGSRLDGSDSIRATRADRAFHLDLSSGCVDNLPDARPRAECTWPADAPTGGEDPVGTERTQAVLLGDSNAGHFTEGFIEAAHSLGLDAVVQTRSGCPFAEVEVRRAGGLDTQCRDFYRRQMDAIADDPPAVVVMATASDLHALDEEMDLRVDGGSWADTPGDKLAAWQGGLQRTLDRLAEHGVGVVVMQPVPRFEGWVGLGGCSRLTLVVDQSWCGATRPTAATSPLGDLAVQADARAAAGHDRVELVDLRDRLCPATTCSTRRDGAWVIRDQSHISVEASRRLAPDIAAAMGAVLEV